MTEKSAPKVLLNQAKSKLDDLIESYKEGKNDTRMYFYLFGSISFLILLFVAYCAFFVNMVTKQIDNEVLFPLLFVFPFSFVIFLLLIALACFLIVSILLFFNNVINYFFKSESAKGYVTPVKLSVFAFIGIILLSIIYNSATGVNGSQYFVATTAAVIGGVWTLYYSYIKQENEKKRLESETEKILQEKEQYAISNEHEKIALFNSRFVEASKLLSSQNLWEQISGINVFLTLQMTG